jgi:hypothetical protein
MILAPYFQAVTGTNSEVNGKPAITTDACEYNPMRELQNAFDCDTW